MTATTNNSAPVNGETASVDSHEVGMMFVHEYYTFLNKEPSRLHCFYNKNSTMSHGVQGEEIEICHGQQASDSYSIHAKILALDFEDCKVLVSNVDSQTSMNGGIMIQVLGEMSNRGGPSQKFAQTFFLAEQPKGYYVLNDIFRYLKDDNEIDVEVIEEEEEQQSEPEIAVIPTTHESEVAVCTPAPVPEPETVPAPEPEVAVCPPAPEPEVAVRPPASEPAVEEKKPLAEEKKSEKKHEHKKHDKKSDKKETKKDASKKEVDVTEKPMTSEPSKKQNGTPAANETVAPPAETPAPIEAPAPAPAQPPKPKTWANLAANNSDQWGAQVSATKGSSVNIPQPVAPKPQVMPQSKPQQQQGTTHKAIGRDDHFPIFVKNITDRISEEQLREALSKFGTVKNVELVLKRNCAYVDFTTADAMQAALKQNKVNVGSEVVYVEERRPRPNFQNNNRPMHFQNGSGGINGHQGPQGGHRGGRPARGGFQDRKPVSRPEKPAPTVAVN
ncbi:hypothetical protein FBU30_004568 [Linnemannia zychae]|nr:hypothetical protein FBU30_004568 [Linnemannia zychae]